MFYGQVEMSFGQSSRPGSYRRKRQNRARWWFDRMRQIVDRATDWQPVPPARPVQIWFPEAQEPSTSLAVVHETKNPTGSFQERQICE